MRIVRGRSVAARPVRLAADRGWLPAKAMVWAQAGRSRNRKRRVISVPDDSDQLPVRDLLPKAGQLRTASKLSACRPERVRKCMQ
jgi:hypothetical protein